MSRQRDISIQHVPTPRYRIIHVFLNKYSSVLLNQTRFNAPKPKDMIRGTLPTKYETSYFYLQLVLHKHKKNHQYKFNSHGTPGTGSTLFPGRVSRKKQFPFKF